MIPDDRDRHEDTKEGVQNNKGDLELESVSETIWGGSQAGKSEGR